jgi:hypothetical protein
MKRPEHISPFEWYEMTDEEQWREVHSLAQNDAPPVEQRQPKPRKPKASKKPAPPEHVKPRTIGEAFALVDGELMRRRVALVEVVQRGGERFTRQTEKLFLCGDRVRFGDRVYLSSIVAHYLTTGELLDRAPREPKPTRYKAQARDGARVVHLGYFATVEERDAAVFAYRLGITPRK